MWFISIALNNGAEEGLEMFNFFFNFFFRSTVCSKFCRLRKFCFVNFLFKCLEWLPRINDAR